MSEIFYFIYFLVFTEFLSTSRKGCIFMNAKIFTELLIKGDFKAVHSILDVMNVVDIALLLEELNEKELAIAFRLIPKDKAADVFSNMSNTMQTNLVEMFTEKELKEILDDLYMDDTVDLLEELPANLVTRILNAVDSSKRNSINLLLNYPEDSAGSIMTTEYVSLHQSMTVKRLWHDIKQVGHPQRNHLIPAMFWSAEVDWNRLCQRLDDDE